MQMVSHQVREEKGFLLLSKVNRVLNAKVSKSFIDLSRG